MLDLALSIEARACMGVSRFDPASLFAGTQGFMLDPADTSTLYQSGSRASPGTAVAADGDAIGLLLDKSGNNNDFTQATSTKRPLYKTSAGLSWIKPDGTDDFLASASIDLSASSTLTYVVAFTPSSTGTGMVGEFSANANSNNGSFYMAATNDPVAAKFSCSAHASGSPDGIATTAASYGSGVASVLTVSLDISKTAAGTKFTPRLNGATGLFTITADAADVAGNFGNYPFYLGARAGTSLFLNGKIHFVFAILRTLTAGEITKVEAVAASRCGVTL